MFYWRRQLEIDMKNKTFLKSIYCAIKGLIFAIKTEKNYKYYLVIDVLFFILDLFVLKADKSIWLGYIITSAGVYAFECINTSIEHISDFISKEIHPEIKVIKDMAAAGVLCFGIAFFLVQIAAGIDFSGVRL
jgi:hypothetical protein